MSSNESHETPSPAPLAVEPLLRVEPLHQVEAATVAHAAPAEPQLAPAVVEPEQQVSPHADLAALNVPLGTLIFRAGLLTEEQLEEALQEGLRRGKRLGEVLVERNLIDERELGRLLAGQKGLEFIDFAARPVDPAAVALLPGDKARLYGALPFAFQDGAAVVAVADPSNDLVTENVRRALGDGPRFAVAARRDLLQAIERAYPVAPFAAEQTPAAVHVVEAAPVIEMPIAAVQPESAPLVQPEPTVAAAPAAVETPTAPPLVQPPVFSPDPVAKPATSAVESANGVERHMPEPVPQREPEAATLEPAPIAPAAPAPVEPLAAQVEPVAVTVRPVTVEPLPIREPEPVLAAQPEPAPEVELVRDSEPVAEAIEPALPVETEPLAEEPSEPSAEEPTESEAPAAAYHVFLRLTDGERVEIASFTDSQKAQSYARDVVSHLAEDADGWPFFGGRFLRPDTIVSVDIVAEVADRWLGSSARANWASRLNR